jgi:AbrB family looped-hinge helix DNA binding protein
MTYLNDIVDRMRPMICTVTERGQVSIPAALRKAMGLKPGQKLVWEKISDHECRVRVSRRVRPPGPVAVLGMVKRDRRSGPKTTDEWMALLRAGEA